MDPLPGKTLLPRGLIVTLGLLATFAGAFILTAPWHFAGRDVGRFSACLGVLAAAIVGTLFPRSWRRAWVRLFRDGTTPLSRGALILAAAAAAAVLVRVLVARLLSLELSAWDTTLYFDHPIAATLSDGLLFCDQTGASALGTHASYVLLAFVPLYAVVASPLWLLAAEGAAIAAGAAAGFLAFRRILGDDFAARLLAVAFLLNPYTARTVQYGFHPEAFYPLAIFVMWIGLTEQRPLPLATGCLLALSVKEDSLLVLLGLAASALLFQRRRIAAAAVAGVGILVFLAGTRIVMPHYSLGNPERPWYASYWASWGNSLPQIALALLKQPIRLARTVLASGAPRVAGSVLLLPLAGPEALVAALPALVPFGAADYRQLSEFALYYSMPILPFFFLATAYGIRRIFATPRSRRVVSLAVLCACAFEGAGYVIRRPHPARSEIGPLLDAHGERPVRVQGSLYPHAGYRPDRSVLDREHPLAANEAILLCPGTDPFPFSDAELKATMRRFASDPRYARRATQGGLILFTPRNP